MSSLPNLLMFFYLVTAMIYVGLSATGAEIVAALRDRRRMGRVLLANIVIVPVLGMLVVRAFDLSGDVGVGVLLLAFAPGGAHAIQFTGKVQGAVPFAAAVLFILSLAALVLTPVIARLMLPSEIQVAMPYMQAIGFGVVFLALPMMVGLAIRIKAVQFAAKLSKPLNLVSTLSFIGAVLMAMSVKKQAMLDIGFAGVASVFILLIGSMVVGWYMGGPSKGERQVLASATGIRNAPLCLLIALTCFPQRGVDATVLAFAGLMVFPNLLFTIYHAIRRKREQRRGGPAAGVGEPGAPSSPRD